MIMIGMVGVAAEAFAGGDRHAGLSPAHSITPPYSLKALR